jgi:hypothetical protein
MLKLNLRVIDINDNPHEFIYTVYDNPVAQVWYKKILHLYRIPLSQHYTSKIKKPSLDEICALISQDLMVLNEKIKIDYPIKQKYDQQDCNIIHDITISTQYGYPPYIREIFHTLHRNIHKLEKEIQHSSINHIIAGWGEKEGLLTTKFEKLPYDLYEYCMPGSISLIWSEFGKTPWRYWKDSEIDNTQHFLKTCKPHQTFRAQFALSLQQSPRDFDVEFKLWFDAYRDAWQQNYHCDWTPLYQWGGVPLARLDKKDDFDWSMSNQIVSISPVL